MAVDAPGDSGASRDGSDLPTEAREGLEALRKEISALDDDLLRLIERRRALAVDIGRVKAELGLPTMDPAREAQVVRRVAERARELGVDEEMARDVIWRIMAAAREAQDRRAGPPSPMDGPEGGRTPES